MNEYQLTIVIPVYNEEPNLKELAEKLNLYLKFTPIKTHILFIDDGSSDGSAIIIKRLCSQCPQFSCKTLAQNYGLSTALKAGFDSCETPWVGYMDADLQTSPQDFMLYFEFMDQYNMVNGIRIKRKDKLVKKASSKIANAFRRVVINDGIKDTCCPLKIIETKYARKIPFFKGMHRFLPALVQLHGGKVKEVEVNHYPRFAGNAKYHLFNRLVNPFLDTLAFAWMKKRYVQYTFKEYEPASLESRQNIIVHE